jgi:hypothetical protein
MVLRKNTDLFTKILFLSLFVILSLNEIVIALHSFGVLSGASGYRIFSLLTVDFQSGLPTFFNALLVLIAFLLLVMVSLHKRNLKSDRVYDWLLLTLAFLVLSLDENPDIHNYFISVISKYGGQGQKFVMTYAWGMPYGAVALLFVFFLIRFISSLPKNIATGFVVSGVIYVYGAIVVATVSSAFLHIRTNHSIWHELAASYEESLEMIGLSLFIYFLLKYIYTEDASLDMDGVKTNVTSLH